jgi:hypothetical protein
MAADSPRTSSPAPTASTATTTTTNTTTTTGPSPRERLDQDNAATINRVTAEFGNGTDIEAIRESGENVQGTGRWADGSDAAVHLILDISDDEGGDSK